jgi:cytochrome c
MFKWFLSVLVLIFLPLSAYAVTGEDIFKSKGCSGCHSKSFDSFAPSLSTISKSYYNKKEDLKAFLRGNKPGLIKGEPKTMKGFINLTKKLNDSELEALVTYLLSF